MEITEVKVFPVRDKKLRAFVSIVLDGSFMVNDIKVIQGKDDLFISMPSRRKKNGRFKDIAHPLNQETRQAMEERIVAEYAKVVEGGEQERPAPAARSEPEAAAPEEAALEEAQPEEAQPEEAQPARRERKAEQGSAPADDKSMEEVAEAHLSDSYWTT